MMTDEIFLKWENYIFYFLYAYIIIVKFEFVLFIKYFGLFSQKKKNTLG